MTVPEVPRWPACELATWELRDYRHQLETALSHAAQHSADHQVIQKRLREVTAEQDERAHVRAVPGSWAEL